MKVILKQNFFRIVDNSVITNENDEVLYKVRANWLSPTHKKRIYDKDGKLLFKVRARFFNWFVHKSYIFDANTKKKIATVQNKYISMRNTFLVMDYPEEIKIDGSYFSLGLKIFKNEEVMATIQKHISLNSVWEIEASEEDMPMVIAFTIAMMTVQSKKNSDKN